MYTAARRGEEGEQTMPVVTCKWFSSVVVDQKNIETTTMTLQSFGEIIFPPRT